MAYLKANGASFFQALHDGVGGGYPGETMDALWSLVWRGLLTNDALHALRAYCERPVAKATRQASASAERHFDPKDDAANGAGTMESECSGV